MLCKLIQNLFPDSDERASKKVFFLKKVRKKKDWKYFDRLHFRGKRQI